MKKAAFSIMIITILSKILGFGRELVLSYTYGASSITDAYLVSQTIPTVIFGFISTGITIGFVPMYSRILNEEGQLSAHKYTSNLINALLLLASVTVVLVQFLTLPMVRLFASGFSGETLEMTVRFTRIIVLGVYFTTLHNILASYLRLHGNYVIPALVGFPMNLIVIAALLISTSTSVYLIAIGSVLGTASQLLLLIPFVRKTGYRWMPALDLGDKYIKMMFAIALPVIFGRSVDQINLLVDRTLASTIAEGGISALNYANRLNGFVQGLFVVPITTVIYPLISRVAAEKNIKGLKSYISEAVATINLLVIPVTIGAMIFSEEIVVLLFGRGAFSPEAIAMTSSALLYYSLGMIAIGLRDILSRAFYALQDTRTPMINTAIAVMMNIVLNLVFSRLMGIGGLALATSLSGIISALLMFVTLKKKIGSFGLREISISFLKISIASSLMGLVALWGFNILVETLHQNTALILAIGVGALTYVVIVCFMKIPEVERTLKAVKTKLGQKRMGSKWGDQ